MKDEKIRRELLEKGLVRPVEPKFARAERRARHRRKLRRFTKQWNKVLAEFYKK